MENDKKIVVRKNAQEAINKTNGFLEGLINTDSLENIKKADLIAYWLKDYIRYLKGENTFVPNMQENYKRGDVVKVNLGFNIGNEEGGLHYAIVINNPNKSSGIITIIPLTSRKKETKYNNYTISLGRSVVNNIISKLEGLEKLLIQNLDKLKKVEDDKERNKQLKELTKTIKELEKYIKEAKKLKDKDSIALVGNITTISKQRVYTPTISNKFLKGVSISAEQLDLIDAKIIELYTNTKKI